MTKKYTSQRIDPILLLTITNPSLNNSSNQANIKRCSVSDKSKILGGLHTLVIKEHSSRSVVSDMNLNYKQYKNTKFGWKSCLGLN